RRYRFSCRGVILLGMGYNCSTAQYPMIGTTRIFYAGSCLITGSNYQGSFFSYVIANACLTTHRLFYTLFPIKAQNILTARVLKGKPPLEKRMVTRRQKPKQLMVWAGLTYTDKTPLIFVHEGVKVQGPQYCAILENKFLP
ncbi:hypothetical protein ANCDUO_06502, partial [Ancylostoma duodenale]